MAKEGLPAKGSSGWALERRYWNTVQGGGPWLVKPSGAKEYVARRYSGQLKIASTDIGGRAQQPLLFSSTPPSSVFAGQVLPPGNSRKPDKGLLPYGEEM